MNIKNISNIQDFLNIPLWDTHTMIFRGVAKAEYELKTSLGRVKLKDESARKMYEDELISEFKRRAIPYLADKKPNSFLDWLCLAQHYGIPTRLLDWTTNPLIALYFAIEKYPNEDFAVYKHIQKNWISNYSSVGPDNLKKIYGLRPLHFDNRFINQEGVFTFHPEPAEPLEGDHFTKYVFSRLKKEEIGWQLRKFGFRPSRIYPGLDGVSKDIIEDLATYQRDGSLRSSGNPMEQ